MKDFPRPNFMDIGYGYRACSSENGVNKGRGAFNYNV